MLDSNCMQPHWEKETGYLDGELAPAETLHVNPYVDWAWSVICWDGVVPFVLVAVPSLAALLFPRIDALLVVINVFLPIFAFFIRLAVGNQRFARGHQYGWQAVL